MFVTFIKILSIFLALQGITTASLPIHSNDLTSSLSAGLKTLLQEYYTELGTKIPKRVQSLSNKFNTDVSFKIRVTNSNSDIGLDAMKVTTLYRDQEQQDSSSYQIKYNYLEGISSFNPLQSDKQNSKANFKCDYDIYPPEYEQQVKSPKRGYDKILRYQRNVFGLSNGALYNIIDYQDRDYLTSIYPSEYDTIKEVKANNKDDPRKDFDEKKDLMSLINIKEVFITINKTNNSPVMITLLQNNTIQMFDIHLIKYNTGLRYRPWLIKKFQDSFTVKNKKIYDVGIDGDKLFISSQSKGLEVYSIITDNAQKQLQYKANLDQNAIKKEYLSFVINEKTIYAIVKNFGLVIYDKSDNYNVLETLLHQEMKKIEYFVHPFTGNRFVSILFNQDPYNTGKEFYMELFINNEVEPKINKVLSSDKGVTISSMLYLDYYFVFFYDSTNNKFYSIRRGILNTVPNLLFTFSLDTQEIPSLINAEMVPFYNTSSAKIQPALKASGRLLIVKNILFKQQKLNCSFNKKGEYIIIFDRVTDSCGSANENDDRTSICHKGYTLNFKNFGTYQKKDILILIGIILAFLLGVGGLVFYYIWRHYQSLEGNRLKIITVDKENKSTLYMELAQQSQTNVPTKMNFQDTEVIATEAKTKKRDYDLAPAQSMGTDDREKYYNTDKNDVFVDVSVDASH